MLALSLSVGSGARVLVAERVPHPHGVISTSHMKKLKNNAFADNGLDSAGSEGLDGMTVDNTKPRGDRFVRVRVGFRPIAELGRAALQGNRAACVSKCQ